MRQLYWSQKQASIYNDMQTRVRLRVRLRTKKTVFHARPQQNVKKEARRLG